MIIVSIIGPTMNDALGQMKASRRYADMLELRLDMIADPNISTLLSSAKMPCIATCRPEWEGGSFKGSEAQRIEILEAASLIGVEYVDIELNAGDVVQEFVRRRKETRVIVSLHVIEGALFSIDKAYKALTSVGADVVKLAYEAEDAGENILAFEFLEKAKQQRLKAVAIAMGEAGEASRLLYKKFGGWATYAAAETGSIAALGQISGSVLKKLYRADSLKPQTRVFGVIGNPLKQSKGTHLHNPLFQKAKMDAVYCKFPVADLDAFMNGVGTRLDGFSVTIPHKQNIMKYLDEIDPVAKTIGAVNTVVRRKNKLYGTNTDAPGALDAIEAVQPVKGKRVLVVGAGGAARAIAYEAKQRGAHVLIVNRTDKKAQVLAKEFGLEYVSLKQLERTEIDIIANATSVGMVPDVNESPLPKALLKGKVVFDAVYNPPLTKLLQDAKSVGAKTISGTEMYLNQAAMQSVLYTGKKADKKFMKRILMAV
ncbi:MAG: shikimate dehydrogenase [Bacteroidota bacterium]